MATLYAINPLTGSAWSEQSQVFKPPGGGALGVSMGTYQFLVNPTALDVVRFCKVPANAVVIGGCIAGEDLDTGAGTLDIAFGWEANGAEAASTTGFGNMYALKWRELQGTLHTSGWPRFTYETWISGQVITPANAGGTGQLSLAVTFAVR